MGYRPYAQKNIDVFWDTIRMINSNSFLLESISNSITNSMVYSDEDTIPDFEKHRFENSVDIKVSSKRSLQAALDSIEAENKTAVLNFANAYVPGGGVLKGSGAQEESICRCSTLYPCLNFDEAYKKYYGYNNINCISFSGSNGLIYSPNITIIKTDESTPVRLLKKDWKNIDIITCAAPHLPNSNLTNYSGLESILHTRIRRILEIAASNLVDNMILGAFGCGAFNNPPDLVARIFKEELKEDFKYTFKHIEFAILGFDDNQNYKVFKSILT